MDETLVEKEEDELCRNYQRSNGGKKPPRSMAKDTMLKKQSVEKFQRNGRTFQPGAGLLPTPFKYSSTPISKQPSPTKLLSTSANDSHSKTTRKSSVIPINDNRNPRKDKYFNEISVEGFMYSELWAGPAYSNSPPPSSLPVPKFSPRVKRTMSLDLPAAVPVVNVYPTA
ncbi:uncharacterized protein LOC120121125 [Hibiscus syriacus]|uniref:uncharacterized protein LOC120121125 n=1 Tax=Hibiscus syriacus TaxID=106335 RepID=UPI0019209EE7|nr:uncharacterized protein LOC120121125 [Hibiscus syriacus]